MKRVLIIKKGFALLALLLMTFAVFASGIKEETKPSQQLLKKAGTKVVVVYFHQIRRCPTCVAIGNIAKEVVEKQYKGKSVKFIELSSHDKENKPIVEELKVFGSGLFVISKAKLDNLTAIAFQTARMKPDILKEDIREKVDAALKK